ncbi:MAG TPA: PAS domain-containing protein [Rhizomicrobium sp.]
MTQFDKAAAQRCFDDEPLGPNCDRVARYWLSLWRGGELPVRADFRPRDVAEQLPSLALFEVVPEHSVRCRLFGSVLAQGLGQDVTGKDWLALTPEASRPLRLERFSTVALGAIGRGLRAGMRESGEEQFSEEIMLPFGDVTEDGTRQVLIHIAWRQTAYNPTVTNVAHSGGLSVEFRLIPLQAA